MATSPTPNLLLATTYGLNVSNTKKAVVGLELRGGLYAPVVKLYGNSLALAVTLDKENWEIFTHQLDYVTHYFQDETMPVIGRPTILTLDSAEISLTKCYGTKTIVISQLREAPVRDFRYEERFNAQLPEDEVHYEEPENKKPKNENTVAMQASTYFGLLGLIRCIEIRMQYLEEQAVSVNRTLDQIIDFLKQKMEKTIDAEVKNALIDYTSFKKYVSPLKKEMYTTLLKTHNFFNLSQFTFDLVFEEMYAYGLKGVAKCLYRELCEK